MIDVLSGHWFCGDTDDCHGGGNVTTPQHDTWIFSQPYYVTISGLPVYGRDAGALAAPPGGHALS